MIAFLKIISLFIKTGFAGLHLCVANEQKRLEIKKNWSKMCLKTIGHKVVINNEPSKDKNLIVVGNHISYLDIPTLMMALPEVCFISKKELKFWPILGQGAAAAKTIFVDRSKMSSAFKVKNKIIEEFSKRDVTLGVFPAGTTSLAEQRPWKKGIFSIAKEVKATVQVFRLDYSPLRASAYIDDDNLLVHMYRLIKTKNKTVTLTWLDAVHVGDDIAAFTKNLQSKVNNGKAKK